MKIYYSKVSLLSNYLFHSNITKNCNGRRLCYILAILIYFQLLSVTSSQSCATTPTTTYYNNTMDGMAAGTYDDPVVVRLYIHNVRQDNGTGGVNELNMTQSISYLEAMYNPFNIYFEYCILDFPCTDCYTNLTYLKSQWVSNSFDDGVNLYLFPIGTGPGPGEAEDVGSKSCYAAVSYVGPSHEIGHCLGLYHTQQDMVCPAISTTENAPTIVNSILIPGANCATAGDRICDTPADPSGAGCPANFNGPNCTFVNPSNILDYLGNPYIDPNNLIPHNIMSYRQCRDSFTPGQNIRMRDMLAGDLSVFVSPFTHIREVSGTETWTSPVHFSHDLLVTGNLTISTEVYFAPGFGIILDGELEIDGGVLDVSPINYTCPANANNTKFWKGISVTRSSIVQIYNSEINNAELAISYIGSGPSNLKANGVIFKNNERSIKAIKTTSGICELVNCDFIVDNQYFGSSFYSQIEFINCTPAYLGNCDFSFDQNLSDDYTREGISAYNSQIIVMAGSDFKDWTTAINVSGNMGTKLTIVNESDFIGNKYGVYTDNFYNTIVSENEFSLSNSSISSDAWGILSSQTKAAEFHHNSFFSTNSSVNSIGVFIEETFGSRLALLENTFSNLDIAFDGIHCGTEAMGIQLLCNSNNDNRNYDFKTISGIAPFHGSTTKAAGNTFSHEDELTNSDFTASNIEYQVRYFHAVGVSAEYPDYATTNVVPINAPAESCAFSSLIQDPFEGEILEDFIDLHELLLDDIVNKIHEIDLATTEEDRKNLTADLHLLQLYNDQNTRDAVSFILVQDSINYADLRTAISLDTGYIIEVSKAFTYLDQGLDSIFLAELKSIDNRVTLNAQGADDLDSLILLNEMLVRVYADERFEGTLTQNEIDTVEYIANSTIGLASNQARALLTYFYNYDYNDSQLAVKPYVINNPLSLEDLIAFPNPAEEIIYVNIPKDMHSGSIHMINLSGVIIEEHILPNSGTKSIAFNTAGLVSGMYIIKLFDEGGKIHITKFIK